MIIINTHDKIKTKTMNKGASKLGTFDQLINRKNTSSLKWDQLKTTYGKDDLLPMWVADMDFRPPEKVLEEMNKRIEHGIFGYTLIEKSTAAAITNWLNRRHQWEINPSWLLYSYGVVPSIAQAIKAFTKPGDKILLQTPVYTPFFKMIESNFREVVNSELQLCNGKYKIDFNDLEEKLKSGVKLFLLCNPHNPGGRVWRKEELIKIAELCKKYDVIIVSDEIHADLVAAPFKHVPIASIDPSYGDFIITLMAPSKTFNLAGLQVSYIIASNSEFKKKLLAMQAQEGFFTLNTFGIIAMEAAYQYGDQWLDEALAYIRSNVELVKEELKRTLPQLKVMDPEGTYLIWIDCRNTGLNDDDLRERLVKKGKIAVNYGHSYGKGGEGFIRLNVACHRSIVEEGIKRLQLAFS